MKANNIETFNAKIQKYRNERITEIREYYLDSSEIESISGEKLGLAVFLTHSIEETLKAAILYDFEFSDALKQKLNSNYSFKLADTPNLSGSHNSLLAEYLIRKAGLDISYCNSVSLMENLNEALMFKNASLKAYGFESTEDAILDPGTNIETATTIASNIILINQHLKLNSEGIYEAMDKLGQSSESIWVLTFSLLKTIDTGSIEDIFTCYLKLVEEWRECEVNANSFCFSLCHLILLSGLVYKSLEQEFSLEQLSKDILHSPSNVH